MSDLILGIDPGLNGAVALVELHTGELVEVFDMPTLTLKGKRTINEYGLAQIVDDYSQAIRDAWIERTWPRPTDRLNIAFDFALAYGLARGVVAASFIPLHDASPQAWKRAMGIPAGADKDASRHAASLIWPRAHIRWPAKRHHGRAEAALIAAYGRRQMAREAA